MSAARSPHRAWVEVDHDAIRHNLAVVRELGRGAQVIGVVKANAYGHGDVEVSRTLVDAGVVRLAVASVDEGARLRAAGIEVPILLLWAIGPAEVEAVVRHRLEPIVYDDRVRDLLEAAAHPIGVHLKVDTGLGRQGSDPDTTVALATRVAASDTLDLVGTMSHLAVPGEDDAYTEVQILRLARTLDALRSAGIDPGLVHVGASGAILSGDLGPAGAVRPGLMLYGLVPDWAAERGVAVKPALALRALPVRLHDLAAGEAIGYGLRFRAREATRIATLPIGYGDGWPRIHANNGTVLVRGERAPIVGAVSMDGLMVDIGGIGGVTYGDEFTLIGEQGGDRVTAEEVADARRTINYEVTTTLRGRLPRLHLGAR